MKAATDAAGPSYRPHTKKQPSPRPSPPSSGEKYIPLRRHKCDYTGSANIHSSIQQEAKDALKKKDLTSTHGAGSEKETGKQRQRQTKCVTETTTTTITATVKATTGDRCGHYGTRQRQPQR